MNKVQELQYQSSGMHESRDFKGAESVHSGPLSHVPSESALFPPRVDQGGLLGRARSMPRLNTLIGKMRHVACLLVLWRSF